jgi:hypothetical protein
MKYIKTYEYHSSIPKWAVDYWESGKEKFPNIQIVKDSVKYIRSILPFTKKDNYESMSLYGTFIYIYFKDYVKEKTLNDFYLFLKDNELEIVRTEHYKETDNLQFTITTSESNFEKMAELYNNITKFNL